MLQRYLCLTKVFMAFLTILVIEIPLSGQSMPVQGKLQAALFKKIFSFSKTLQAKGGKEVMVIFGDADAKDEIVSAFKEAGVPVNSIKADGFSSVAGSVKIVYVAPGATPPTNLCAKNGILSITGVPSLVENGKVAVGIMVEGGKPKIIVNLARLKAEGHELSADLLKLAKIVE